MLDKESKSRVRMYSDVFKAGDMREIKYIYEKYTSLTYHALHSSTTFVATVTTSFALPCIHSYLCTLAGLVIKCS